MVNYQCPTCGKDFKKKCHYIVHTEQKKNPCQPNSSQSLTNSSQPLTNSSQSLTNSSQPLTNSSQPLTNSSQILTNLLPNNQIIKNEHNTEEENVKNQSCAYCGLIFNRKDNLKRHINNYCKVKILDNEHKEKTFELLLRDNEEKDKKINDIQKQNDNILKQLEQLQKQMEKQINKAQTQNINKGNVINNTNNIIIPQSRLTDFGKEDYEKINIKRILNSIKDSGVNGIINCLNDIHYNEETPQYKNVFITDKSRDKGMIYEEGQWKVKTIKFIVSEIITHIERYVRIIEKRIRTGKYKDIIDPEDPDKKKKINTKEFKKKMESRLKKYILRYYGDDEETTPKDSKKFSDMVFKYVSNRLFDVRDGVYKHYEKVLEDIQKDVTDPEIKKINEEQKQIIQTIDSLKDDIKKEIKEDIKNSENENDSDDDSDESDESDDESDDESEDESENKDKNKETKKDPEYVQKTITLLSGLKKVIWIDKNADINDYYNF